MTDSSLPPTKLHNILLIANEGVSKIAPDNDLDPHGIWYNTMTFNGTIPGPLIIANQGDMLRITLKNEGKLVHSLNSHAGFGPNQALSGGVNAGASKTWTMKVNYPGAFLCNNIAIQGYHEIVNIPPGLGAIIEVTFPEPGTYFGNDHDVGSILYGAGFIVIAG